MKRVSSRVLLGVFAISGSLVSCSSADEIDPESHVIGLLLPFTGTDSANSRNFERAALFARDEVNAGGGVKGHELRIISADTHSDPERARDSVMQLINAGADIVIGPESAEISSLIKPILDEHKVSFMSPVVGAADAKEVDCTIPWFRLAPSSFLLGESLAKLAFGEDTEKIALLHSDSDYDVALAEAFNLRFSSLGGAVAYEAVLPGTAQSYARVIKEALASGAEAILLAASPRAAALVVNELGVLSRERPQWYLSPLLKTELLLQNVVPEILEGAIGVSPKIFDTSDDFPHAFSERWQGDEPLDGAYFYYDAIALSSFALSDAEADKNGHLPQTEVAASILDMAGPPGEAVRWNEIPEMLPRLSEGERLYYTGLSGPLLLRSCGDRQSGATSTWTITAGKIVGAL